MPVSKWDYKQRTRGYGTQAPGPNLTIDRSRAEKELMDYIYHLYQDIKTFVSPQYREQLTDNQKIALLSFGYNLGMENFKQAFPFLAHADISFEEIKKKIPQQMIKYVYAGGKKLKGLENRRRAEINLFVGSTS